MTSQKDTPQNNTPEQLLEQISAFVEATVAHVADGGDADLAGLDAKVQELCDAVLDLPRPEALVYEEKLAALVDSLSGLKDGLESLQGEVRGELASLDIRHKAARAYQTGSSQPLPPKTEE